MYPQKKSNKKLFIKLLIAINIFVIVLLLLCCLIMGLAAPKKESEPTKTAETVINESTTNWETITITSKPYQEETTVYATYQITMVSEPTQSAFKIPTLDLYSIVGMNISEVDSVYSLPDSEDFYIIGDDGKDIMSRGDYHKDGYTFFVTYNDAGVVVGVVTMELPDMTGTHLLDWDAYLSYFGIDVGGKQPDSIAPIAIYWDNIGGKRIAIQSKMGSENGQITMVKISDADYSPISHK